MTAKSAFSALALGATLTVGACAPDGATAPTSAPSAPQFQQNAAQAVFGNLIAALNNINAQIIALNNIDISNVEVNVVRIGNLDLTVRQVDILNNVLNNNAVDIALLQDFLNDNDIDVVIGDVLSRNNVEIGQVVAIDVLSGGDVIIFAR